MHQSRDWRDPSWNGVRSIQNGLDKLSQTQRRTLFGDNLIDIQGKSTLNLLIDEVLLHPLIPLLVIEALVPI